MLKLEGGEGGEGLAGYSMEAELCCSCSPLHPLRIKMPARKVRSIRSSCSCSTFSCVRGKECDVAEEDNTKGTRNLGSLKNC
eukprot:828151-Pelagomonas_calceolata.AAC.1